MEKIHDHKPTPVILGPCMICVSGIWNWKDQGCRCYPLICASSGGIKGVSSLIGQFLERSLCVIRLCISLPSLVQSNEPHEVLKRKQCVLLQANTPAIKCQEPIIEDFLASKCFTSSLYPSKFPKLPAEETPVCLVSNSWGWETTFYSLWSIFVIGRTHNHCQNMIYFLS